MERLISVSGLGDKEPAAFVLEAGGHRVLLDFGAGPDHGAVPDIDAIGRIDAVVLSHGHADHVGSLPEIARIGDPPVYATDYVHEGLTGSFERHLLPETGETDVLGIGLSTGRSGHAPGGVWLRFEIAGGLLYMGDNYAGGSVFAADPPPHSQTVILDTSYKADGTTLAEALPRFADAMAAGPILLPVPADGRAVDMALLASFELDLPVYGDARVRRTLGALAGPQAHLLAPAVAADVRALAGRVRALEDIDAPAGVMLAAPAHADNGITGRLVDEWAGRDDVAILFSGHVARGSRAQAAVESGRGRMIRWPVHPNLAENAELVRAVAAERVVPAFGGAAEAALLAEAFAPANLRTERELEL